MFILHLLYFFFFFAVMYPRNRSQQQLEFFHGVLRNILGFFSIIFFRNSCLIPSENAYEISTHVSQRISLQEFISGILTKLSFSIRGKNYCFRNLSKAHIGKQSRVLESTLIELLYQRSHLQELFYIIVRKFLHAFPLALDRKFHPYIHFRNYIF